MSNPRIFVLNLVLGLAIVAGAADTGVETTIKYVPEPPVSSSTSKPTTQPTSKPPTTTTVTTTKPTTSTTTTEAPHTTTITTTTTTPKPTTAPPVPTTPKPAPSPEEGTWEVISSGNNSCILLHMMAVIEVYHVADNQTTNVDQYPVPKGANATGTCGATEQTIKLSWPYNQTVNDSIEFVFKKNDTKFDLERVTLNITIDDHKNSTALLNINRTKEEFCTPITMSYKCKKGQALNFTMPMTNFTAASLHISDVQFQAFGNITKETFSTAKDCEPYETPDIVPIAVGCALIALILFVLVGYLIGRRRNQARGYLSM